MSLQDDLDQLYTCTGRDTRSTQEWQEPYNRLRAALSPAAEKWLEALPELLELADKTPLALHPACDLDYRLRNALHEAAALHAAASAVNAGTDNKEQK